MSDAHLTDHEWKLKMAAEGKAVYVPGKTEEQIMAERKERERVNLRVCLEVNKDAFKAVERAVDNAMTNYGMAADAFELMSMASSGELVAENDFRLSQTLQLLSHGMRHLAETEGSELAEFGMMLFRALRDQSEFIPADAKGATA